MHRIALRHGGRVLDKGPRQTSAESGMKDKSGTAAVLSFVIPGVGQIYNGKFLRGIFWLIVTPGLWIGSGGTLGWICHLLSAFTAYRYASTNAEPPTERGPLKRV